jgi:hypothetical protein
MPESVFVVEPCPYDVLAAASRAAVTHNENSLRII